MMAFHVSLVRDTCGEKRLKLFSGSPPFLQEEEKGALEEGARFPDDDRQPVGGYGGAAVAILRIFNG